MRIQESWAPVRGFENAYEVSNTGKVRSLARVDKLGRNVSPCLMKIQDNGRGYKLVMLSEGGYREQRYVHRMVAESFVSNPHGYDQVNHIDGNKGNNEASNLEWCTPSENMQHSYDKGLHKVSEKALEALKLGKLYSKGNHKKAVVRDDGAVYETVNDAAADLGTDPRNISSMLHGHQKTVCGHTFKFLEVCKCA